MFELPGKADSPHGNLSVRVCFPGRRHGPSSRHLRALQGDAWRSRPPALLPSFLNTRTRLFVCFWLFRAAQAGKLVRNGAPGKAIVITSQAGSCAWRLTQNPTGGNYGHHMSRAACNMMAVLLSQEFKAEQIPVQVQVHFVRSCTNRFCVLTPPLSPPLFSRSLSFTHFCSRTVPGCALPCRALVPVAPPGVQPDGHDRKVPPHLGRGRRGETGPCPVCQRFSSIFALSLSLYFFVYLPIFSEPSGVEYISNL
jgi:hypothetical protein